MNRLLAASVTAVTLCFTASAAADCQRNRRLQTEDHYAAPIRFGRVTLTSPYLQPPGSLLASVVVPPTDYTATGANADTVLWRCDASDLPNLRFLVSTNGDSRFGGHNDIGRPDGLVGVYATWFDNVGLRLTMDGVTVTRYWKSVPLASYATSHVNGKDVIDIRLQDIPPLHAELYRVSQITPNAGRSSTCSSLNARKPTASGTPYDCQFPNAYIQLAGYGSGREHDLEGEDHNTRHKFWRADNGFAYRLYGAATLLTRTSCAVRNATPHVKFPPVTLAQMQAGREVSVPFNVQIECNNAAPSGTGRNQVTIGIQVSPGAWRAAQTLNLVNGAGGVAALVSDQYGLDAALAQGVAIKLKNADTGNALLFAGQGNTTGGNPISAGWYPIRRGSQKVGASDTEGYSHYQRHFIATLHKLPGQTVTAGRIHATGYVVVKVQ